MKKILLFGGSGLLGRALNDSLKKNNELVMPNHHVIDISKTDQLRLYVDKENPDIIINAAGMTNVYMCEKKSASAFLINAKSPAILASIAKDHNIKFLHFSTNFVFDGQKGTAYDENDEPNPLNIYAKSKRQGELMILENYPESLIIRSAELFGKGPFSSTHNIPYYIVRQIVSRKNIHLYDIHTSPTHAFELADKVDKLIETQMSGIIHMSNSGNVSYEEIADMLFTKMKRKGAILKKSSVFDFDAPKHIAITSIKENELNIPPMKSFEAALDDFLSMVL